MLAISAIIAAASLALHAGSAVKRQAEREAKRTDKPPGQLPVPETTTRDPIQEASKLDDREVNQQLLAEVQKLGRKGIAEANEIITNAIGSRR